MDNDAVTTPQECEQVVAAVDLAGFSRACGNLETREVFDLLRELYALVARTIAPAGGRMLKGIGDAALLTFPAERAREAVDALRVLQKQGETWAAARNTDPPLRMHVRAHLGPVTLGPLGPPGDERLDVVGRTVNELFLMRPGELVLSSTLVKAVTET